MFNLVGNAEKFTKIGSVTVNVTQSLQPDGKLETRFAVTDTGPGIDPEDRERLFAPYFSTRKNGTGLGLAIASRIVADHGGYIDAEPNNPHGARFVVELPVCPES